MTGKLFTNPFKINWNQNLVIFSVSVYILINIFQIGGDAFVINLNNNLTNLLAVGVVLLAFILLRGSAVGVQNRLLWLGLTIGWTLWTIAEFWWAIAAMIGQEVPYPSWADFFWLVGYVPMYIALWERLRPLPRNFSSLQMTGIRASILITLGFTIFFVFIPILQNSDPSAVLESALNILYPLADLILLVLALQILFAYQQGMYGRAWTWLIAGFAVHSVSNLFFSYATTADLFYPNGQVNFLSTLGIDVPYNLSYLLWLVGLFVLRDIQASHHTFTDTDVDLTLVPDTHILVFTKGDDTVIDVSQNYSRIFPQDTITEKTISEILGISAADADSLLTEIKTNRILKERSLLVDTLSGKQTTWISGVVVHNPQGEYAGVMLLLRIFIDGHAFEDILTKYEKDMINSLLGKTGTKEIEDEEIKQLLSKYYLAYLKGFYNRVFSEGGSIMTDAFLTELQSTVKQHGWQISIRPDNLLDVSALTLSEIRESLPVLFERARRFVAEIIDPATADTVTENVRSHFNDTTLRNISRFEKAKEVRAFQKVAV